MPPSRPVLHDTVTLRHFASVNALNILEVLHGHRSEPRWTQEVHSEIERASLRGIAHCSVVLQQEWLGTPVEPALTELKEIARLQIGLNDGNQPACKNLGEAESIYFAEQADGNFATDDNGAFDFAMRRSGLGPGRVIDTVDILRCAVTFGDITASQAAEIADEIEATDRELRPCHRVTRNASYFDQ